MRVFLFLFSLSVLLSLPVQAALSAPVAAPAVSGQADLSRSAVEAQLGRKLKFTERIVLSLVRKKAKKQARKRAHTSPDGTTTDAVSLISMILGILAFVTVFIGWAAVFLAIAALVLGIVGLGRVNRSGGALTGKGFAIAGIALGGTWLFLLLLLIGLIALTFGR